MDYKLNTRGSFLVGKYKNFMLLAEMFFDDLKDMVEYVTDETDRDVYSEDHDIASALHTLTETDGTFNAEDLDEEYDNLDTLSLFPYITEVKEDEEIPEKKKGKK